MISYGNNSLMWQGAVGISQILLNGFFQLGTRIRDRPNYSTRIFTFDIENHLRDFQSDSDSQRENGNRG